MMAGSSKWVAARTMALARDSASARSSGLTAVADLGAEELGGFFVVNADVEANVAFLHEDSGADEDCFCAELHHEGCVGGGRDAAGGEVGYGELAGLCDADYEFVGSAEIFRGGVEFLIAEDGERLHLRGDGAHVLDGVDDVAGAGLALGADHGCAFGDAAEGFAEVFCAADEGRVEGVLVDVVEFVGGGEDFGLVDEVDREGFENLGFDEVADAGLGHDGDADGLLDGFDHAGMRHAGHAALCADHGGNAFERHDGDCAGLLGDDGLVDVHDVHDDAALEHLCEAGLQAES